MKRHGRPRKKEERGEQRRRITYGLGIIALRLKRGKFWAAKKVHFSRGELRGGANPLGRRRRPKKMNNECDSCVILPHTVR